jgi:hypothetical protein
MLAEGKSYEWTAMLLSNENTDFSSSQEEEVEYI